MGNERIVMTVELFMEIQKFIWFIDGFITNNEQIDCEVRDKISEKIKNLDERLHIFD